jgi:hypothetical protein
MRLVVEVEPIDVGVLAGAFRAGTPCGGRHAVHSYGVVSWK